MTLHVIHHDPAVDLGSLDESLRRRTDVNDVDASQGLPAVETGDAVLLLGGRQTTVIPDRPAWMDAEIVWVADLVAVGTDVFGICLGAQVLGVALGGEVAHRERPEVRLAPLHRTAIGREDPVVAGWPDGASALVAHKDEVIRLPGDSEQLLIGSDGPTLWRYGPAYACQAHLEATPENLASWLEVEPDLAAAAYPDDAAFIDEVTRHAPFLRASGTALILRWLDEVLTRR